MTCPPNEQWHLLSLDLITEAQATEFYEHAAACEACRARLAAARQDHARLLRGFEAFDAGHDQMREQLIAALPAEPERLRADRAGRYWRLGEVLMSVNWRNPRRSAAAVLATAACLALVAFFVLPSGTPSAFAAAVARFHDAQTIVCRVATTAPVTFAGMELEQSGKLYVSADHGCRYDNYANGTLVTTQYTPLNGPVTVVNAAMRNFMVIDVEQAAETARQGNSPDAFIRALQRLSAQATRELPPCTINGVAALGYEISGQAMGLGAVPDARSELWIDPATNLPLRYVAELPGFEPGTTLTLVYDEFEWDVALDPQLFTPAIPAGYARLDAVMPAVDEAALLNGLARFAELTDRYPTRMDMTTLVGELASGIAAQMVGGASVDQQSLMQQSLEIGTGCAFYQQLVQDGRTPEYFGATVKPRDGNAVLLRWQLPDGGWREVYGDLRVATTPAD